MLELLQVNRMQLMGLIIVLECLFLFISIKRCRRYKGSELKDAFEGSIVWIVLCLMCAGILLYRDVYKGEEWTSGFYATDATANTWFLGGLIFTFFISTLLFVLDTVMVKKDREPFKITQKDIKRQEAQWKKQIKLR